MTTFNEHQFEKRLQLLKDSQESIQSLSAWCLHNRQHHKKIVACWLRVLKKVKIEHRLTLFYLANDVIQYSKRKNYEFVESWGTALQRATTMVREEKVKQRILRIFKIWDERGIYDEAFISDLSGLLSTTTKRSAPEASSDTSEFQPPVLIAKIQSCKKLEDDTDLKLKRLNESRLSVSDADALRSHLKDRRQGDDLVAEVDEGLNKMQEYMKALEREIKERNSLIELLEQAETFYETQKGEAKVVANAYRNFGSRVKNLKKRLDELKPKLRDVSPVPSPDINAPSPSPDSDIDLPGENENTGDSTYNSYSIKETHPIKSVVQEDSRSQQQMDNCFSSFMNTSLPFDIQKSLFSDTSTDAVLPPSPPIPALDVPSSPPPVSEPSEGKPIEVITRPKPDEAFNVKEFLKTLISSGNTTTIIPGLDMDSSTDTPETDVLTTKQSIYAGEPELNTSTDYDYPPEVVSTPLQPPPMPPNLFPLEESPYGKYGQTQENEDSWNTKLPPKFPTWGDTASSWEPEEPEKTSEWMPVLPPVKVPPPTLDTPESPPMYEKEGFSDPVEYDDSVVEPAIMSSSGDVDHRTLVPLPQINHTKENECHIPPIGKHVKDIDHRMFLHVASTAHPKKDMDHRPIMPRKKDVDHRNLISLTGSPVRDHSVLPPPPAPPSLNWLKIDQDYRTSKIKPDLPPQGDQDYRLHQPHPVLRRQDETQDNVESVDMEMSDEEAVDMLENIQNTHMRDDGRHDKKFEFGSNVKSMISFNINSQAKVLVSSPLNENKDESVQNRGKIYGCQKIPTISGVGGNVHSPRGMGSGFRPRGPPLQNPVGIKRFPPPNVMRGFRHTLLLPPPPPPQLTPPESFNVPIEIKPQAEIEAQENVLNIVSEEKEKQETVLEPELEPVLEQPAERDIIDEKENLDLSTSSTEESDLLHTEKQNTDSVVNVSISTDTQLDSNPLSPETDPVNGNESIEPLPQPVITMASQISVPVEGNGSEHWMNNELAELEQQSRTDNTNNFRGRGIARPPFKTFMPRGAFNPRARPPWNGPRRGGPPPMRFPFRPPIDRPFGRGGPRGGFRPPFRGNRGGNFGGW